MSRGMLFFVLHFKLKTIDIREKIDHFLFYVKEI